MKSKPLLSLQVTPSWAGVWSAGEQEGRGIWTGWVSGLRPAVWCSMRQSAEFCLGWQQPRAEWLENCPAAGRDLEVLAGSRWGWSSSAQVTKTTIDILACITKSMARRTGVVAVPLCLGLSGHTWSAVCAWGSWACSVWRRNSSKRTLPLCEYPKGGCSQWGLVFSHR